MAYIANTAFEVKISNHEFDSIANITGKYQASNADAEICPGFLATRASLVVNEGYDQVGPAGSTVTLTNTNTWVMNDAVDSDTAQKGIYACNPFDVNMASDGQGNFWKVGANTLSIKVPAGYLTTWTKIEFNNNNVYRFGIGNLSATLGSNTYFTIDDGLLVPGASAPASAGVPYFELVRSGTFTEGAYAAFDYVDVRACISEA
jgi:hypothetical protein